MKHARAAILGLLLAAWLSPAVAQNFPTVPSGTVIGRTQIGTGPAQAIPIQQLFNTLLTGALSIPSVNTNSVVYKGSSSGQATVQTQAAAGTPTISLPNTTGTLADNATSPIVLNLTTGNISCPGCLTVSNSQLVVTSRASAQGIDLSAASSIHTLGYATPGDGGEATFVNVGSAAFHDTYITAATLVGGSGYTNGTYLGVPFTGGTGAGCEGSVTVSGGAVTSLSIVIPCAGYKVGDILTTPNSFIGGTGSGFTYTVTAISTPKASFTDQAGTNWQFVPTGAANILQFGAKGDWNGSDGTAMNNSAAMWSAAAWASFPLGASSAQVNGNQVLFPRGAYMTCGAPNFSTGSISYYIPIPQGVRFSGTGVGGTTLKECASDSNGTHYIELCDSNAQSGQFGCRVEEMTIDTSQVTGSTSNIAVIYSNSGQQFVLAQNLEIDAGNRSCVFYEIGKGGASNAIFNGIDCEAASTATNDGMRFNSSGTQIVVRDSVFGCAPSTCTRNAVDILGGSLLLSSTHIEGHTVGVNIATTNAQDIHKISDLTITTGCVSGITIGASNPNNTERVEGIYGASCSSHVVTNGHTGGSHVNASINGQMVFNP